MSPVGMSPRSEEPPAAPLGTGLGQTPYETQHIGAVPGPMRLETRSGAQQYQNCKSQYRYFFLPGAAKKDSFA